MASASWITADGADDDGMEDIARDGELSRLRTSNMAIGGGDYDGHGGNSFVGIDMGHSSSSLNGMGQLQGNWSWNRHPQQNQVQNHHDNTYNHNSELTARRNLQHPSLSSPSSSSSSSSSNNTHNQHHHGQPSLNKRASQNYLSPASPITTTSINSGMALSTSLASNTPTADQVRMSYSPLQPLQTSISNTNAVNPGLGIPRSLLPASMSHQQQQSGSSTSISSRPSQLLPTSSYSSQPSHHPSHQHFNRTNSSGSALSISTSPTTTGGQGSPMTPSSPGYSSTTPLGQHHQPHFSHTYHQPSQHASVNPSPVLSTGPSAFGGPLASASDYGHMSPTFRTPNPPSSTRPPLQQQQSNYPFQQQQQPQYYSTGQSSSAYLNDPSYLIDRRQGSYSPSHYALNASSSNSDMFAQQQSAIMSQGQSISQSPFAHSQHEQHPQQTMQSPRRRSNASASTSYLSPVQTQHSQFQQQQAQSPGVPGQPQISPASARRNLSNAAATSFSSATSSLQQHQTDKDMMTSPTYQAQSQTSQILNRAHHQHTQSMSSSNPSAGSTSYSSPLVPSGAQMQGRQQRSRSAGSAFRKVREISDLKPNERGKQEGRRADPEGGTVSPLKALTTQLSQTYHLVNPHFRYEFSHNPRRVLTKPSKPAGNDGYDNDDADYILYVNDVLGSEGNKYLILDVLGQGTFGQVVKCQNMKTHEIVGVKVIKNKPAYYQQSMMEITILEMLNLTYDFEDKHHILRLKDTFVHCRHLCLVFELLSSNLYELIKQNAFRGLSTSLVRVFTEQLLDALCVLKDARLIHCDLKPENILLKTLQSPDIKVIDFGSACHERQTVYTYIQSRFYRSPEVLLGLPYSTSIDMWSLGCICVELFLGLPLFPGTSEFNQVTRIVEMLGSPPTYMLETGKQVSHFFNISYDEYGRKQWHLKSLEEYERQHPNTKEQPSKKFFAANTLPEIIKTYPNQRKGTKQADLDREMSNRMSFIDFVSGLLNMNPMERWTPQQARMHPFVLNEQLRQPFVPSMGFSTSSATRSSSSIQPQHNATHQTATNPDRPYGGLPPTPARASARTYHDAATYQQHLNQQQAQAAIASANAYRQAHYPTNPYAPQPTEAVPKQAVPSSQSAYTVPRLPPLGTSASAQTQQRLALHPRHSPSQSVSFSTSQMRNSSSGPLSPSVPTNPPAAHHYSTRNRSGTFSQLDVPPALQKLGLDLSSFKAIGTPQLRRDDQRAAWERRHGAGESNTLDRRRSLLRQANPHLEHLEYYAQSGQPGYPYSTPSSSIMAQPFSVVIDPRMQDHLQHHPAATSVTIPPPAYAGVPGSRYVAAPPPPPPLSQQVPPIQNLPYDAFDQYDVRDGINAMLHQPLVPTTQQTRSANNPNLNVNPPVAFYGPPQLATQAMNANSIYAQSLAYPAQSSAMKNADNLVNGSLLQSDTIGKQRKSDAQMWP